MVFRAGGHKVLHTEQGRAVLVQVLEKVVNVHQQQLDRLLVQRGKCQHRAQFDKQSQ